VETFIGPGASATNDRRSEFQRMIETGPSKPAPLDVVVVVHSFSRFFRDHFELEFYVRKPRRCPDVESIEPGAKRTRFFLADIFLNYHRTRPQVTYLLLTVPPRRPLAGSSASGHWIKVTA